MVNSGLVTIVAFISPFKSERNLARNMVNKDDFVEVFIDTPLNILEERDPKGLYKKARSGEIPNFTGINSSYEIPENPEIVIETVKKSPEESAYEIVNYLKFKKILFL